MFILTTSVLPLLLRPVAALGFAQTEKIAHVVGDKNIPSVGKQPLLTTIGEGIAALGSAGLLVAENGVVGSCVILIGLGLTGLGFFLQPNFNVTKKSKDPAITEEPPVISEPAPKHPAKLPTEKVSPPVPELTPAESPTAEETLFKEQIDRVTSLKTAIVNNTLPKSEEKLKVTELLNTLRATIGKNSGLERHNYLKLRKYTLALLSDIIIDSKNEQTIKRSLEVILNLFIKDTRDPLKSDAGAALLALISERLDISERLILINPEINKEKIIKILKDLKK